MAATTMDPDLERHYETWLGFTRLMRWTTVSVVVILVLMAIFLL
jgi:hypothetical protein